MSPLIQGGTPRLPVLLVEWGILALVVFWAWSWGRAPSRELRLSAIDALLFFFGFWALFSTLFAPYYHPAESASLSIACFLALYWCLAFNPSFSGLSLALRAVRAQAAFQAVLVLAEVIRGAVRPAGTFYNPNFLAGFLAASLLLVVGACIFPSPGPARRPLWLALALAEGTLFLAALLTTGSRGGVLALAAGLVVLLLLRSWKVAVAVLSVSAAALLLIPNPFVQRLQMLPRLDNFAFTRIAIWKSAWAMMLDHPWLGIGLGQYEFVSTRYAFPVTTHWAKYTRIAENAHSEYLQAGAELGVPGLLVVLGVVALLAHAAGRRLRALPRASWGPVATPLAAIISVAAHSAVDFPLHTPPAALLLVLLAAGMRLNGATGPASDISFRVRPAYAAAAAVVALLLAGVAVRPVIGFWYFLGGLGAPRNLFNEHGSLEMAQVASPPPAEAARLLGRAVRVDFVNASYRRALGSVILQAYQQGEGGPDAVKQSLYQLLYAAELNPNQFEYQLNLGQMMTTLARRAPPGREQLEEALEHYRSAVKLAPFKFAIHSEIGLIAEELGDLPAAEAALRRAVTIEEYHLRGWLDLGGFYARHERLTEAREALRRGAALAEKAATLVPTTDGEREMLALKPAIFYNALKKIEAREHPEGLAS